MKIAFNPSTVAALITPPNNKDITFDLRGRNIFARGVKFCGTDTWRDIKINNVSIGSNILDLRNGSNTTLTNTNGVVTINSTWRPVVDNLTSDSTTSSLSANQGRVLKSLIDGKSNSGHIHDDRYLRLAGGWMSGDINFGGDNKIHWGRNTDSASISFKNDGDGDADSYMSFVTSDNGNEYFKWSHSSGSTNTEWMALRSDGLRVGGTKVSLEGHSHNNLYYTKTEVNNKLNGKSDTSHTHDDRYLKLTGGTMSGTIYRNSGGTTISGRDHAIIRQTHAPGGSSWNPIACVDTETGTWTLGHLSSGSNNTDFNFCFSTNADYNAGNNNGNYVTLRNKVGTIALLSDIPSSLKNPYALTISLNGTSQGPYDGSAAKNINITPSSIGAATSDHNHDSRYVRYYTVTTLDCNNLAVGLTAAGVSATNAAHTNHSAFLYISDVGTPFQLQIPDFSIPYIYKRYYHSGTWSEWFKLNAGYADSAGSATKLQTARSIWGQSFDGTADVNGTIYINNNNSSEGAIRLNNNINSNARISAIDSQVIFNTDAAIRFGGTSWDWNVWAGLKYTHSNKTIYLGIADNSIFNANSTQSGGSLRFPGISNVYATTFNGSLSGNASTATILQTTRTLWGQSFNGSNNVSGNMSGVGQISFSNLSGTNGRALLYQQMADDDFFRIYVGGTASNSGYVEIATADDGSEPIYVRQYTGVFSSVVRTLTLLDANGYTHFPSYINIGGNENNNSSPDRVWGSNGSDSYLRSYRTSALRVSYANSADTATTSSMLKTADWYGAAYVSSDTHYMCLGYMNCTGSFDSLTLLVTSTFWGNQHGSQDIITIQQSTNTNDTARIQTTVGRLRLGGSYERSFYYYKDNSNFRLYLYVYVTGGNSYGRWNISYLGGNVTWVTAHQENVTKSSSWISIKYSAQVNYANSADSATKLQTPRTIWGQSFDGTANVDNTLRIRQTTGNYCEGIRIQTADGAWSTIILGATADSGTNTNAWSIHRKSDNNFAISRNSSDGTNGLVMTSTGMGLGTTAPTHRLDVRGDTKITGSIRDLAIGGGIYWNPYVESTTDGTDAASITVVKSGVAGGTTLVLSQMSDANDTIQFKTNGSARLYHNSYPILTTQNTYVSNNKGYINGTEITQVNNASSATNADMLDGYHLSTIVDRSGENLIIGTTHASTIGWNQNGWEGGISTYDENNGVYKMWSYNGWHTLYYTLDAQYASKSISFSFDIMFVSSESTEGPVTVNVGASNSWFSGTNYSPSTSGSWEHKQGTFTLGSTPYFGIIIHGTDNSGKACLYRIKNLKVELGDLPTIWTPAHADISWDNLIGKPSSFTPSAHNHDGRYLRLSGDDTMTGQIKSNYNAGTWINGCTHAIVVATYKGYNSLIAAPIKSGNVCISAWNAEDNLNFGYAKTGKTDNNFDKRMYWDAPNNNLHADYFTGHLSGTADNADKLDGIHANGLLTSVTNSNNGISVTVGGTTKSVSNISVNYANSAGNADTVDGYHATSGNNKPWGTIPAITSGGYMDIGKHLEFHFDNTTGSDYSTILMCTGNYSNIVNLPSAAGTLALTSDIPTTLPANGGNADTTDGVHITWAGALTSTSHLVAWEANGSALRDINPAHVTVGNSDKVDGYHANGLLTALSNSDKGISITVGGTTKSISNISVNYANSAGNADTLDNTHLNGIFTAFGNNGHNITATIGGTTKSFLVNWAADSDKLDGYHASNLLTSVTNTNNGISVTVGGTTKSVSNISVNYAASAGSASSATQATNLTPENTPHYFRDPSNSIWRGGMYWGNAGSESMSFVAANGGTRFQFVGGSDIANWTSSTWQSVTPYLTIYSSGIVTSGSVTATNGFHHVNHDNNDAVLLAGGGYSQGVPVKYWSIESINIYGPTQVARTNRGGNYTFVTKVEPRIKGSCVLTLQFPSGYNDQNTIIWAIGVLNHDISNSSYSTIYATILQFSGSKYYLNLSDDDSLNNGSCQLYFMCF